MFNLFRPLSKYLYPKPVPIYDGIFMLHSKVTVTILLACSLILSAKQYFGEPIDCISDEKNTKFLNHYCWTLGTYIVDNFHGEIGGSMAYLGIRGEHEGADIIYLRYYQWVVLILILQAIMFFLPAFLWKVWEGGRLTQLCSDLGSALVPETWESNTKKMLVKYFTTNYKAVHMCYTLKYFLCELLNFIFCIVNIWGMNTFISGFWVNYAPAVTAMPLYDWELWNRLSSRVFPKITKCRFTKFGSSGSVQTIDAICILPLNILNEKIFAFLWLWFLFLTVISGINIIYRIILMANRNLRGLLLRAHLRFFSYEQIHSIINELNLGDWFLLYRVGNHINPVIFKDLMSELLEKQRMKKTLP